MYREIHVIIKHMKTLGIFKGFYCGCIIKHFAIIIQQNSILCHLILIKCRYNIMYGEKKMSVYLTAKHLNTAEKFVNNAKKNNKSTFYDAERFWYEQENSMRDPWHGVQVPLGMVKMPVFCAFAELGFDEDFYRLEHDAEFRSMLCRQYNDLSEKLIGRRIMDDVQPPVKLWPEIKTVYDIFESKKFWHIDSYWNSQSAKNEYELDALLDRVEYRIENINEYIFPADWHNIKTGRLSEGRAIPVNRSIRGPVTLATTVYGVENLVYLINDNQALAQRFRDLIIKAIIIQAETIDKEFGTAEDDQYCRFSFFDDNCALLNREMYEFFGYPVLKAVFEKFAPRPENIRFQHSDSSMEHLLPVLVRTGINDINFGPDLALSTIRRHFPKAVIRGQLAPFTFSRNEEINMVAEFIRDFETAKESKGIIFSTSGSINNGSRLSGLRLLMTAVRDLGKY
ncbi:MAG: hypothetical protein A2096_06975 [Spirochaetes bacterium GWF1_41_5]|nr:MAG: hypothetical protein A2096_06975 [Spirochaetes bacterium GWF1_41_5]